MFARLSAIALALALLSGCGVHSVDTGFRGIKVSFGQVEGPPLSEGLYFVNPFTTSIVQMDTRTQAWTSKTSAYTHDIQAADVSFTLNYRLDPSRVALIYRTVGKDWEDKLVGQVVYQDLKDEIAKWDAVDLVANRQRASDEAQTAIMKDLAARDVMVSGFFVTDIAFSAAFDNAVEAKVIAAQQALQAQNKTAQIQQEANQTIITAKAAAESMQIRADALEKNSKLIEWEAVQRWNGVLPTYMMGNAVPFISMSPPKGD